VGQPVVRKKNKKTTSYTELGGARGDTKADSSGTLGGNEKVKHYLKGNKSVRLKKEPSEGGYPKVMAGAPEVKMWNKILTKGKSRQNRTNKKTPNKTATPFLLGVKTTDNHRRRVAGT